MGTSSISRDSRGGAETGVGATVGGGELVGRGVAGSPCGVAGAAASVGGAAGEGGSGIFVGVSVAVWASGSVVGLDDDDVDVDWARGTEGVGVEIT
jgi:hypothetical protein